MFQVNHEKALEEEYADFERSLQLALQSRPDAAEELGMKHTIESNTFTVDLQQSLFGKLLDVIVLGLSLAGFLFNSFLGLLQSPWHQIGQMFYLFFGALATIIGTSERFWESLTNVRSFGNFVMVSRIRKSLADDRRDRVKVDSPLSPDEIEAFFQDSDRYLRYATAAYGPIQIAGNIVGGVSQARVAGEEEEEQEQASKLAVLAVALYVGVPFGGILYCSKPGGTVELINHFVAVDHDRKEVVLAIRGTYSVSGINTDLDAKGVEFCGGQAHGGFVERVYQLIENSETIVAIEQGLQDGLNKTGKNYELKLVGHSLGAGIACLINILLQTKPGTLKAKYSKLQCYGYACPPAFTFSAWNTSEKMLFSNCFCYINEQDTVPFLSLYAGQRLFETLLQVDNVTKTMSLLDYWATVMGWKGPPPKLCEIVKEASDDLPPGDETERLKIPSNTIVWMRQKADSEAYDYAFCSRNGLAKLGVNLDFPELITDHFPPEYDRAISYLSKSE